MRKAHLIFLVLLGIAILVAGCAQQEQAKPEKTPTPSGISTQYPSKEYASLKEIAEKIRSGEIDVGNDYTMALNGRFHRIHNKVLSMDCSACHVSNEYAKDFLYQRKYKVPTRSAPGVVDRGVCLGCHKEGGIATPWYGTASE